MPILQPNWPCLSDQYGPQERPDWSNFLSTWPIFMTMTGTYGEGLDGRERTTLERRLDLDCSVPRGRNMASHGEHERGPLVRRKALWTFAGATKIAATVFK